MRRATKRGRSKFALLVVGAGIAAAWPLAAQTEGPCESDERYRALDFLIGEWRLVSGGEVVGRSRVEKLEGGCLVAETWVLEDGDSGRTYSSYDAAARLWRRFSVSNRGVVIRSAGSVEERSLLFRGERAAADGPPSSWRERLTPGTGGRISRTGGYSRQGETGDQSATVEFEGYYAPVGLPVTDLPVPEPPTAEPVVDGPAAVLAAAEPATAEPEAAEPEAAAPTTGEVTPDSARASGAEKIERIAMASPMVLRLPMGTVEALPSGYAWVTRDTAPYLCEGVTIERLEVGWRRRRGRTELEVELAVHGRQVSRAVDVSVDLRRSGGPSPEAVVASGAASSRVGRSIPEQVQYGSVAVVVTLSMDAEIFDSVVADPERPDLVITLAVGK